MTLKKPQKVFIFICAITLMSLYIVLPAKIFNFTIPRLNLQIGSLDLSKPIDLKEGLDIKGGLQVTLTADMKNIAQSDRATALESAKTVISRRIDLFGVSESGITTAVSGNDYRLILELPGVTDAQQALNLIGQTAQMQFALPIFTPGKTATESSTLTGFTPTDLTGADLARAAVTFETQDSQPGVSISFQRFRQNQIRQAN